MPSWEPMVSSRARYPSLLLCLAALALPTSAAANPAVQACEGKREGDACGLMKMVKPPGGGELQRSTVPGTCRADECCDLDYSKGSPPETVCHACTACKEGPADLTPPPAAADDPAKPADGEPPRTENGPPPTAPAEQRGCTLAAPPQGSPTPLLAFLALPLLTRRRRQPPR